MIQLKSLFLLVCVFGILCSVTSCKRSEKFQTAFPLDEVVVTDTLEQAGLPGTISDSESETSLQTKKDIHYTHYVVRDETEHYDNTETGMFVTDILSADYKGKRMLYMTFDQRIASNQIEWENWKAYIVFAALLYGGFENEEDIYQAFLGKELPEGKTAFQWDAQLPEGYCTVSYHLRSGHTIYDKDGFARKKRSAFLRVNIYESYDLYQELKALR